MERLPRFIDLFFRPMLPIFDGTSAFLEVLQMFVWDVIATYPQVTIHLNQSLSGQLTVGHAHRGGVLVSSLPVWSLLPRVKFHMHSHDASKFWFRAWFGGVVYLVDNGPECRCWRLKRGQLCWHPGTAVAVHTLWRSIGFSQTLSWCGQLIVLQFYQVLVQSGLRAWRMGKLRAGTFPLFLTKLCIVGHELARSFREV